MGGFWNSDVCFYLFVWCLQYGTRHIIDTLRSAGQQVELVVVCGGLAKNKLYVQTHADILGLYRRSWFIHSWRFILHVSCSLINDHHVFIDCSVPSVLWYCWLGLLTCKKTVVACITYTVLAETLNHAQSINSYTAVTYHWYNTTSSYW